MEFPDFQVAKKIEIDSDYNLKSSVVLLILLVNLPSRLLLQFGFQDDYFAQKFEVDWCCEFRSKVESSIVNPEEKITISFCGVNVKRKGWLPDLLLKLSLTESQQCGNKTIMMLTVDMYNKVGVVS